MSEVHLLAHAGHALLRGGPEGVSLVSTEAEDGEEHGGEVCVMRNPIE